MDEGSVEYFSLRERAERAAAAVATSIEARRIHLELATRYAALLRGEKEQGSHRPRRLPFLLIQR